MSGFSSGSKYKVKMTLEALTMWWNSSRRRSDKVAHETWATFGPYSRFDGLDCDGAPLFGSAEAFTVRHYRTNVVRVHPEGVEMLCVYPSQVTRDRINALLPKPWRVWSDKEAACESVLVYCENVEGLSCYVDCYAYFTIPAERGVCTDFKPTVRDVHLSLGCRVGDVEAADALAASLESRGHKRMAQVVREYRGKRFAAKGQLRHLQALYAGTEAYVEKTSRWVEVPNPDFNPAVTLYPFPRTITKREEIVTLPEAWLFDAATGEPVRTLTTRDVCFHGADPKAARVKIEGRVYEVVRERVFERFGAWKNRFEAIHCAVAVA